MKEIPVLRDKRIFELRDVDCSRTVGDSVTVPDESMSIQEIMLKHVRGMNVVDQLHREGVYGQDDPDFDSEDLESLARMDLADKSVYVDELKATIAGKKAALALAKQAIRERFEEAARRKAEKRSVDDQSQESARSTEADGDRGRRTKEFKASGGKADDND